MYSRSLKKLCLHTHAYKTKQTCFGVVEYYVSTWVLFFRFYYQRNNLMVNCVHKMLSLCILAIVTYNFKVQHDMRYIHIS